MQKLLANGLILRTLSEGIVSDREQLPLFCAEINGEGEPAGVVEGLDAWMRDLINDHPTTTHDDIFVIVDPAHNERIVSTTLLIPQQWRYEEIPIWVGRPELVGTHPEYRGRGLIRSLFAALHERSAALGHQLQSITGIPYFYRQFGYNMSIDLGDGASFALSVLSDPPPDQPPVFHLRPATVEDIPDLMRWHNYMARERLVTEIRSVEDWRHELVGHHPRSLRARHYLVIVKDGVNQDVNPGGEGVGYVELSGNRYHQQFIYCPAYVVGDKASYLETCSDVMHAIKRWAVATYGDCPPLLIFAAGLHPALNTLIDRSLGGVVRQQAYKWYLRVPDPVAFLRLIQPVLERRLEGSGAHRYTGDFKIGFYDSTGIRLTFKQGRIVEIAPLQGVGAGGYDCAFPWHFFWNVVFGENSVDELRALLPDVQTGGAKGVILLDTLFPKKKSWIDGMG